MEKLTQLKLNCERFLSKYPKRQSYLAYWTKGFDKVEIKRLSQEVEDVVAYLENSRKILVINKLMDYPYIRQLLTYQPVPNAKAGIAVAILFPIGLLGYWLGTTHQKNLKRDIRSVVKVSNELMEMLKDEDSDGIDS